MKKSIFTVTMLGAFGNLAQAETAVTIYGSVDNGIRHLTNANANGGSKLSMSSLGSYYPNRLGIKGVEDLGDGLNAHFTLESGFNGGTGALDNTANALFSRSAFVGIGGAFGTIDLGRQYNTAFKTMAPYEPLRVKFVYIALAMPATSGVRSSNSIQYAKTFDAVTARAEYSAGEVAGSTANGATQAIGLSYKRDSLYLGTAYTKKKTLGGDGAYYDYRHFTFGGAYTMGAVRFSAGYTDEKQATSTVDTTNKYIMTGVNYDITPALEVSAAYYSINNSTANIDGKRDLYMLMTTYYLSKRTNLYAEIDRGRFSGASIQFGQTTQTGFSAGVAHQF
ncbi:MAG TPA: porin [Herbaspirillum sp.]|jgi:predicted porin